MPDTADRYQFTVDNAHAGMRADVFITEALAGMDESFTRSRAQKLFDAQLVYTDDAPCRSNLKLKRGTTLTVTVPEAEENICAVPEDIPIDIVYQDANIAVINKPKCMVVHPAPGHSTGTLVNAVMYHIKDLSGIGGELRPGIVHRIDKLTSGLIVIAKNDFAHASLSAQIKAHTAFRTYIALVAGNIKTDTGTVDAPIGRSYTDRKKMAVHKTLDDTCRSAVTHYEVLRRFGDYTLIVARLETGRTHQIRVHMAYINHPVAGDEVYGTANAKKWGCEGQLLHAVRLELDDPVSGERKSFYAPLPDYFVKALSKFTDEPVDAIIQPIIIG